MPCQITPANGQRTSADTRKTTPSSALYQMPSRKKSRASPVRCAMNAPIATPNSPETAGCSGSLRTSRHTAMATATPIAATSAGPSEATALTSTKTTTGTVE
jgi:hypothetical protein